MMRNRNLYSRIASWSLGILSLFGLFTYLTFIPEQTFAEVVDPDNRTMDDIHYMQEMNTKICAKAELEKQYQLIDIRDGKTYYVARLADNMCWMTQNLDLNLYENNEGITLTTRDSDVTSDLKVVSSSASSGQIAITKVSAPSEWPKSGDAYKGYYDPGDYVYTATDGARGSSNSCTSLTGATGSNFDKAGCESFQRVDDMSNPAEGQDLHYHLGNYYSWSAATVGSGDSLSSDGGKAEQSICPKGWKLPLSKATNNSTAGSFYKLLSSTYGVYSDPTNGSYAIYKKPLYFVYGGYLNSGNLNNAGWNAYYWSSISISGSGTYAYNLNFDTSVNPSTTSYRYIGSSVRCVNDLEATTSESFPYTPPIPPAQGTANIAVTVSPVISLDVSTTSTSDKMTVDFTEVATSKIITNVSSNYQYTVSISTAQTKLLPSTTDLEGNSTPDTAATNFIPMITADTNIQAGNVSNISAWGIKKKLSALSDNNLSSAEDNDDYSPVGTENPEVFYKSSGAEARTTENDPANPLEFTVGVGVSPNLPSGKYSTVVTITASVI